MLLALMRFPCASTKRYGISSLRGDDLLRIQPTLLRYPKMSTFPVRMTECALLPIRTPFKGTEQTFLWLIGRLANRNWWLAT